MAVVKMMQGDSYAIFVDLKVDGKVMTPDKVSDVEITVGESFRKLYSSGEVGYESSMQQWYFLPTQEETFAMEPGAYDVQLRLKLPNEQYSPVKGISVGRIIILDAQSGEVI